MLSLNELTQRLKKIEFFFCDVDGVLTDGGVFISQSHEFKQFHILDGMGINRLQEAGIRVGWFSGRPSAATARRAQELNVEFLYQDRASKADAIESILRRTGRRWEAVCYVGDDLVDLGAMRRAGVAICVPEAVNEIRAVAHYVTQRSGGRGAVREAAELVLKAQNKWDAIVRHHSA